MENHRIDPKTITGWAIDSNPANDPTYPIKHYTGDDHDRINWKRPYLQTTRSEILKSTERPYLTAVFGSKLPPRGLSGALRRSAYKSSENMLRRWFKLILADRIDVLEGRILDLLRLRLFGNDRGWRMLAKYKPGMFIWKILLRLFIIGIIVTAIVYFIKY